MPKKSNWKPVMQQRGRLSLQKDKANPRRYLLRWYASDGIRKRKILQANNEQEAIEKAQAIATPIEAVPRSQLIDLDQSFEDALAETQRGNSAREGWDWARDAFVDWLIEHQPHVENWADLTAAMIDAYQASLAHYAANTIRLRLQPIRQVDAYMHRRYATPRICDGLRIRHGRPPAPPATVYIEDVIDLLAATRRGETWSHLTPGIALQGLAALRLSEAYRLTWDRVDLKKGVIEISGETKNAHSRRILVLPRLAVDLLREAADQPRTIRTIGPEPVVGSYSDLHGYGVAVRKAIAEWNPDVEWSGKDLRNCLPTWANQQGHAGDPLERYLGHAPATVTARHYVASITARTRGQQTALEEAIKIQKKVLIQPWERAIKKKLGTFWADSGEKALDKVPNWGT